MLQMYDVGGIIKSNLSLLYLPKHTEELNALTLFVLCVCFCACVYITLQCPLSFKSGKTIIESVIKVLAGQVQL